MADALELLRSDLELASWFDQQQALTAALQSKFRTIPVPEGLKEQILSERHARRIVLTRRPALVGVCLAIVLAVVVSAHFFSSPGDIREASFRDRMARIASREYPKMDLETKELTQIQEFLKSKQAVADYELPAGLGKASATGCAILKWRGYPVSMICFDSGKKADPNDPADVFLFVIPHAAIPKAPPAKAAKFAQMSRVATVTWSSGGNTYLLAGFGDKDFLRNYYPNL